MNERDNRHGMTLNVYRQAWCPGTDFTLNGVTSRASELALVGVIDDRDPLPGDKYGNEQVRPLPDEMRVFLASGEKPTVALIIRQIGGPVAHIAPVEWDEKTACYRRSSVGMHGGNYASTSDSRVGDLLESLLEHRFYGALAVHDRFER